MKNLLILLVLMLPIIGFSQNTIKGKIVEHSGEPLAYTEVVLQDLGSNVIKSTLTDEIGSFTITNIPKGSYKLNILYFSTNIHSRIINIEKKLDLNTIIIDKAFLLEEVVITPDIKLKNGINSYDITNIENSKLAKNKSTLEFLNKMPIINVSPDGKSIKIKHSKNVSVLINGKDVGGNAIALSILQSIPATDIKKIEVFENPGSKYRANDNGIINVIVNKRKNQPIKVVVSARSSQSFFNSQNMTGYCSYSKNKWSITSGVGVDNSKYKLKNSDTYIDFTTKHKIQMNKNSTSYNTDYTPYLNVSFDVSKKQTVGMRLSSRLSNNKKHDNISSCYYSSNNSQKDSLHTTEINDRMKDSYVIFYNLNHKITTDSLNSSINSDFNYYISRNNRNIFNISSYNDGNKNKLLQNPDNTFKIIELKSNYDVFFKDRSKLTTGFNFTKSNISNDNFFGKFNGIEYISNPLQTNLFRYKEDYFALYTNYQKLFSEYFGIVAGLRYEYMRGMGSLAKDYEEKEINNSNLFPSLALLYNINENHQLILKYNSSITRTPYRNLSPFVFYNSPNSIKINNPYLENTKSNLIMLRYTFFEDFNLDLGYKKSNNLFNDFDTVINDIVVTNSDNYGDSEGYGASFYFNKRLFNNFWILSLSTELEVLNIRGEFKNIPIKINDTSFNLNIKNDIFLDKKKNAVLSLTYGYDNGFEDVFGKVDSQHSLSMELSKTFKSLYLSIGAYDLLNTGTNLRVKNSKYGFDKINEYFKTYYINLRYTFGNKKVRRVNSQGQINDRL